MDERYNPDPEGKSEQLDFDAIKRKEQKEKELVGRLVKLAEKNGEEMTENEARALLYDKFLEKAYSHSAEVPDIREEALQTSISEWLERN
jgi:hypothetical protein